jgi:hypothetical protein
MRYFSFFRQFNAVVSCVHTGLDAKAAVPSQIYYIYLNVTEGFDSVTVATGYLVPGIRIVKLLIMVIYRKC